MACRRLNLPDAAAALRCGGVLILATDTLPGLHARADRPRAVERIRLIKGRAAGKPLLVLAASLDQARGVLAPLEPWREGICRRCWPGPFTLILPGGSGTAPCVAAPAGTLAVRVPAAEELRALITAAGFPLVSTSVNRTGEEPCLDLACAEAAYGDLVDGSWSPPDAGGVGAASCLVDLADKVPRVLREGPLPFPCLGEGAP